MIIKAAVDLAVLGCSEEQILEILLQNHPEITATFVKETLASELFKAIVKVKKNAFRKRTNE